MTSVIALVLWVEKMRNPMGLEIIIRPKGRSPADEYYHKGQTWIEGRHNSDYVIQLSNHTPGRMCVVVSVDGLSVTDGKPASYNSDGFVVDGYSHVTIPGWLLNSETSAKFLFGSKNSSYAAQTNSDTSNVGVIGAAWFDEEVKFHAQPFVGTSPLFGGSSTTIGALSKGMVGQSLASNSIVASGSMGTGFGDSTNFNTTQVSFKKRSNQPLLVQSIFYDSADALQRMGIRLRDRQPSPTRVAFPGSEPSYCKPPPSWVQKTR